jgi:pilus assembly protein Flp/PilA
MFAALSAQFTTMAYLVQKRLGNAVKGATAVEYALLLALIAAVIITAVTLLGTSLKPGFTNVTNKLPAA